MEITTDLATKQEGNPEVIQALLLKKQLKLEQQQQSKLLDSVSAPSSEESASSAVGRYLNAYA
jgi:hypothetical protein